jgi:hypothetical protein
MINVGMCKIILHLLFSHFALLVALVVVSNAGVACTAAYAHELPLTSRKSQIDKDEELQFNASERSQFNATEMHLIKDPEANLNWFAATDEQVQSAPCKTHKVPSLTKMKSWLEAQSVYDQAWTNEVVNGVQFRSEKQYYVKLFQALNSHIWDVTRPITYHNACDNFYCAVTAIFGSEAKGVRAAYLLARYGYNTNHHVRPTSVIYEDVVDHIKPWSTAEFDVLLLSLSDLPQTYPVTEYNKTLLKVDAFYNNRDTVLANSSVHIFRPWLSESFYSKQATVVHEIGHNFDSGAEAKLEKPWSTLEGEKISRYAKKNANEDFAESVVGYRYNAKRLIELAPQKYEALKEHVFDGVEYLNNVTCRQPSRTALAQKEAQKLYQENLAIIQAYLSSRELAQEVGHTLAETCGYEFYSREKSRGDYNYRRCFSQNLRRVFSDQLTNLQVLRMPDDRRLNDAVFNNVNFPQIFILRVVSQFKNLLRQQMVDILHPTFQNIDGVGQHVFGQFYDLETFCGGFHYASAYYAFHSSRRLNIQGGPILLSELFERLGQRVCRQVYANKKLRTPVDKVAVWFAVDEILE